MRFVRDRPATFSRNPGMPTISLRMIPELLKLKVWSNSLASKYSFAIILDVSSLGTRIQQNAPTRLHRSVGAFAAALRLPILYCIIPRNRTSGEHTALTPNALSRQQFV